MDATQKSMDVPACPGCAARDRRIAQLDAQVATLNQRIARLEEQLAAATRGAKRQSAPFSKGAPKENPKTPGRKGGADYGTKAFRPIPPVIDDVYDSPLPRRCPCGGVVRLERVEPQYQTEIPRRPIYRQFNVQIGQAPDLQQPPAAALP